MKNDSFFLFSPLGQGVKGGIDIMARNSNKVLKRSDSRYLFLVAYLRAKGFSILQLSMIFAIFLFITSSHIKEVSLYS